MDKTQLLHQVAKRTACDVNEQHGDYKLAGKSISRRHLR